MADPFGFEGQSELYSSFRPSYPSSFIRTIQDHVKEARDKNQEKSEKNQEKSEKNQENCEKYVDLACGSGQVLFDLSPSFPLSFGVDRSEEQLRKAKIKWKNLEINEKNTEVNEKSTDVRNENASYIRRKIEFIRSDFCSLPFEDQEISLISVGQALHWFNIQLFFENVNKMLKKSGFLAILGYKVCSLGGPPLLENLFKNYYRNVLGSEKEPGEEGCFWDISRPFLDSGYRDLKTLFLEKGFLKSGKRSGNITNSALRNVSFEGVEWKVEYFEEIQRKTIPLKSFIGYLKSWSSYNKFMETEKLTKKDGLKEVDPLFQLEKEMEEVMGGEKVETIEISTPFFMFLCQKV